MACLVESSVCIKKLTLFNFLIPRLSKRKNYSLELPFFLDIFLPDILFRLCELIILKAEAVNEVFTHLLHLVIRKPL